MRVFIISLLIFSIYLQAEVKKTIKSGKWSDPAVWGGKTNDFIPSENGDTIIVNNYVALDRPLNFTNTILTVSDSGFLCGQVSLYFNDASSILFNEGTINIIDLTISRGRPPMQNTTISSNTGSISYTGKYTTPNLYNWTYLGGNQPVNNRYTCFEYPSLLFSTYPVETCNKTCITMTIPSDIIQKGITYNWILSDPEIHYFPNTFSIPEFCYTQNTVISVKLVATNNIDTDTLFKDINVFVNPEVLLKVSNDTTICENQKLQLNTLSSQNTFIWWHPNKRLNCYNCKNPVFTPQKGDVEATIVAATGNGDCEAYDTVNIKITKNEKNFLRDTTICRQGLLEISDAYDYKNIIWNDGTKLPSLNISESGQYWATITNQCGTKTDSANVKYSNPQEFTIPNVFTPNGDLVNDLFEIIGIEAYDEAKLSVFNRWGNKMFEGSNPTAAKWDGNLATDGVYFYSLETKDCNNIMQKKHGIVQLIR